MSSSGAGIDALRKRVQGSARNGTVGIRSFDQGVVETVGAVIDPESENYFIKIEGLDPPPGMPGVPVTFSYPEEVFEKYKLPVLLVRRDDIAPAMQRWHPGAAKYRAPGSGALPVTVGTTSSFDRFENAQQATPFDLVYTLEVRARHRGGLGVRNQANRLLDHVLRVYQPYGAVVVQDSIGDYRTYEAFMEGVSVLDEVAEVAERMIGFAVTLRIEGELDLNDPVTKRAVTKLPKISTSQV